MSTLGNALVLASLFSAAFGAVLAFAGALRGAPALVAWARRLALAFASTLLAANAVMELALLRPDFSVSYVAQVGSREVPLWVRAVSLWSSLEGSILFWGAVLGVYVLFALRTFARHRREEPWALGILLACATFFALVIAGPASPFGTVSPAPADGPGPNPLLQNHLLMIVHPPALYLGYVAMAVPFALASAALFTGRLSPTLLQSLRRWTIVSWLFLTAGIVLGAWWAYEVLGWGGYWGWDPVENAPLMPWLTAAAAVHAALVVERKRLLAGWTVALVMVSFLLTILGTFMTRSGIFNSVHAFAQSDIGPTFLGFLALCLVFTVVLLSTRLHRLASDGVVDRALSREGLVVAGNLVLVLVMLTVLLGTTFPLVAEAVRGLQVSVGEPYFDRMTVPMGVALLFLVGVGPALPWGRSSPRDLEGFVSPAIAGTALVVVGLLLGARDGWLLATLFGAGFAATVTLVELVRPLASRARHGRFGLGDRRRFGGYLAHLGLVVALVAVGVSHVGKLAKEASLQRGGHLDLGRYEVTLLDLSTVNEPQRQSLVATFQVTRDGEPVGTLAPRLNYYFTRREPVGTPAVRTGLADDLYLSAMSIDPDTGLVGLRAFVNPMVGWLWASALVLALGLVLAGWPRGKTSAGRVEVVEPALAAEPLGERA